MLPCRTVSATLPIVIEGAGRRALQHAGGGSRSLACCPYVLFRSSCNSAGSQAACPGCPAQCLLSFLVLEPSAARAQMFGQQHASARASGDQVWLGCDWPAERAGAPEGAAAVAAAHRRLPPLRFCRRLFPAPPSLSSVSSTHPSLRRTPAWGTRLEAGCSVFQRPPPLAAAGLGATRPLSCTA